MGSRKRTGWQVSARTKTALAAAHGNNNYSHGQEVKLPQRPIPGGTQAAHVVPDDHHEVRFLFQNVR